MIGNILIEKGSNSKSGETAIGNQKYQCLPLHVPPFPLGFKSLINEENYDNPETIDTSRTDKDNTSRTNRDDSIENVRPTQKTNDNDEYNEDNLQHQDGNESVINKNKEDKALIKRLVSMNFKEMPYNM